jgi:tetratricopeptide (TPR) repeat protein
MYEQIVADVRADRPLVARALLRLAECHRKRGDKDQADKAYDKIISKYSDQKEAVAQARLQLARFGPNARKVAESFLGAVREGAWIKALQYVMAGSALTKQMKDFEELFDLAGLKITSVHAGKTEALAVTTDAAGNHGRHGSLILILWKEQGAWLLSDVDLMSPAEAQASVEAFAKKPGVTAVPSAPTRAEKKLAQDRAAEGWRLWQARKLPEAEEKFEAAVALDPGNAGAWNGLGWAHLNQGKRLRAGESFERVVAIDPDHAAALNGLGWIAKGRGKTDEAIAHLERAVEALPTATAALSGLATTYADLGRYGKAVETYQTWLKAETRNADVKSGLKNMRRAKENVEAEVPVAEAWLKLVDAEDYGSSWDEAAELFRNAVTKNSWKQQLRAARAPRGDLHARKLATAIFASSLPGAPDGAYVVIRFEASFENKRQAVETITPTRESDGKWRVSGYYIK